MVSKIRRNFRKVYTSAFLSQRKCTLNKDIPHTGSRHDAFFVAKDCIFPNGADSANNAEAYYEERIEGQTGGY